MENSPSWFVIINPTSGNGSGKHKWPIIERLLKNNGFDFDFAFTEYENHSFHLVQEAIRKRISKIICVGGDGTLHNIVNGIISQSKMSSKDIAVGMIPVGTGNDWIKSHCIPNNIEKAFQIILKGTLKTQDLGKIEFLNENKKPIYFNNLAGIGFDGLVVSKVYKYKRFGAISYLIGAVLGLFSFKDFSCSVQIKDQTIKSKSLMVLAGLCQYSGGGMQLTKDPDPFDGLLDISIIQDISKMQIVANLVDLFNGKIVNHKKLISLKSDYVQVNVQDNTKPFVEADGELIGTGSIKISLVPRAFTFYGN